MAHVTTVEIVKFSGQPVPSSGHKNNKVHAIETKNTKQK